MSQTIKVLSDIQEINATGFLTTPLFREREQEMRGHLYSAQIAFKTFGFVEDTTTLKLSDGLTYRCFKDHPCGNCKKCPVNCPSYMKACRRTEVSPPKSERLSFDYSSNIYRRITKSEFSGFVPWCTYHKLCKGQKPSKAEIMKDLREMRKAYTPLCVFTNGVPSLMEEKRKGSVRYNTMIQQEMLNIGNFLESQGYSIFLVTATVGSHSLYSNTLDAWRDMRDLKGKLQKRLNRIGDTECLWVYEAHEDGFPHIHGIVATKKDVSDAKERFKRNGKYHYVYCGWLFNEVHRIFGERFCEIRRAKDSGAVKYALKYVTKSLSVDFAQSNDDKNISNTQYKNALTMLAPMCANVRSFSHSKCAGYKEFGVQRYLEYKKAKQSSESASVVKEGGSMGLSSSHHSRVVGFCCAPSSSSEIPPEHSGYYVEGVSGRLATTSFFPSREAAVLDINRTNSHIFPCESSVYRVSHVLWGVAYPFTKEILGEYPDFFHSITSGLGSWISGGMSAFVLLVKASASIVSSLVEGTCDSYHFRAALCATIEDWRNYINEDTAEDYGLFVYHKPAFRGNGLLESGVVSSTRPYTVENPTPGYFRELIKMNKHSRSAPDMYEQMGA